MLADGSMVKYMILPIFQQYIYVCVNYYYIIASASQLYELYSWFSRNTLIPDLKLGLIHIGKSQFFF